MKTILLLPFWLCVVVAIGQTSDCPNALVVCSNEAISTAVKGFGVQELDNSVNPCSFEEVNSIWFELNFAESGTLAFTIRPDEDGIGEDFDFYVFGPNTVCNNLNDPLRCSTTNPLGAGLDYNTTGLRDSEVDTSEGPGPNGNSFVKSIEVTAGDSYRLLIDRPHGISNFILEWTGTAKFFEQAEISEPAPIELCLASFDTRVDLTQSAGQIVNSPNILLEYFNNISDVFGGSEPIIDPTLYSPTAVQSTVFVKVTNDNGCFDIVELPINAEAFISGNFEYFACDIDNDLFENFQLTTVTADIEALLNNASNFAISLHANEPDASGNTAPLDTQNLYRSESTTIFARITANNDATCFIVIPVALNVVSSPIPEVAQSVQCDVDSDSTDGIAMFNLTQVFIGVPDLEFYFYRTLEDLNNDIPIVGPASFTNTIAQEQTIYYKAISNSCENTGSLQLLALPVVDLIGSQSTIIACDTDPEDIILQGDFDLDTFRRENYTDLDIAFYSSLDDATLENSPLPDIYNSSDTIIYVRLENDNQCQGIEALELIVNPLPVVELEKTYQVCTDGEPLTIDAPSGFDSYTWYRDSGSNLEEFGNTQTIAINQNGNFRLVVGKLFESNSESTTCISGTNFEVLPSSLAVFEDIIIEDLSENNSIEIKVLGEGDYEFSIDGSTYQDEPIFENLEAGFYTILVQDKKGCGTSEKEIAIIGFPEFFTPNGDGTNDTWQIIGASNNNLEQASISIFDRYGKLLAQINTSGKGWDGTLNNNLLPEADYWFKFERMTGTEFRGHFTLKR